MFKFAAILVAINYVNSTGSIPNSETKADNKSFKWDLKEPYKKYLEKVCQAIQEYPACRVGKKL